MARLHLQSQQYRPESFSCYITLTSFSVSLFHFEDFAVSLSPQGNPRYSEQFWLHLLPPLPHILTSSQVWAFGCGHLWVGAGRHHSAAAGPHCGCFITLFLQPGPSEAKQVVCKWVKLDRETKQWAGSPFKGALADQPANCCHVRMCAQYCQIFWFFRRARALDFVSLLHSTAFKYWQYILIFKSIIRAKPNTSIAIFGLELSIYNLCSVYSPWKWSHSV